MEHKPWVWQWGKVWVLLLVVFGLGSVLARGAVPQFKAYPATPAYNGKSAPLVLSQKDQLYRTRLREAASQKPNFAGHYILDYWGCGAGCVMGAVIDAKTGKVYWFPHTICCWPAGVGENFNPVEYRLHSRLIIFSGWRDEKAGDDGAHFYSFDKGRFVFIQTVRN